MLIEIQCDKFAEKIDGKLIPRGKIIFHKGLNTVLGDKKAENSIGKSTFLLIIDFCFGGDDYCNPEVCNVVSFVGHHKIQFAFKFGDKVEYYSRSTINKGIVMRCDTNYNETGEELSISDFNTHLFKSYSIQTAENSFRDIVGRFFRIYGRKNYYEQEPLKYGDVTVASSIKSLEQLYGFYHLIKSCEEYYESKKKRQDVRKAGLKIGEITAIATSKKQVKNNEKEIERLTIELEELIQKQDQNLSNQDTEHLDQAAKIKGQIAALKRRRSKLVSQLAVIKNNLEGGMIPTSDDIIDLQEFFPEVNIAKLESIESFHKKIQAILTDEMTSEVNRLELLITAATDEMNRLEDEQRNLGVPTHVSKKFLERVVDIERHIAILKAQNHGYTNNKKLKEETETAKVEMLSAREGQLAKLKSIINQEMLRLNDFIYDKTRYAPEISFGDTKTGNPTYTFGCKWNTGTGENYKNLIIFDLGILGTTDLPALIHDSLVFKNIADLPIDKIMALYMQSTKQIFISFDKQEAFDDFTSETVTKTKVIEFHDDGGELFGWSWAKVKENQEEQLEETQDKSEEQNNMATIHLYDN